jgi:NAD(P)-dependent dehydrogenase (short-subunit alcohol dehydrogenase family)
MNPLTGMRVIVTGAASGIGRATARLLVERNAHVIVADLKEQAVAEIAEQLAAVGTSDVAPSVCDVRSAADCDRLVNLARQRFEGIDALVHCAGILRPPGSRPRPLFELEESEYDAVVGANLKGTFLMNRAVLKAMAPSRSGQIINISSTSGKKGRPLDSLYSASKAGVIALSESIAEEVRPFGIRVQVILPDAVATPLWEQNGPLVPAPPGSLPPERIAEVIALCLALPGDMVLDNLVVMPFRSKTRGRRRAEAGQDTSDRNQQ